MYAYVHRRSGRCPAYCKWIHEAALCSLYVLLRYRTGARARVQIMRRLRIMTTSVQTLLGRPPIVLVVRAAPVPNMWRTCLGFHSWAGSSYGSSPYATGGPCRLLHAICCMLHVACCMPYMLLVVVDCNVVVRLHSDRKWRAVRSASAALPASKYRREDVFGQLPVRLQEGDRHSRAELRSGETKGALLTGGSRARARRPSVRP